MRTARMVTIGTAVLAAVLLAGCAPTSQPTVMQTTTPTHTPTATATPTPTPTPSATSTLTLSADQEAALAQTRGFLVALDKLGTRPASEFSQKVITKALQPYATGPIITTYLDGLRARSEEGIHVEGDVREVWADVAEPNALDGVASIEVTVCRDQRAIQAVDANGKAVDKDYPDFVRYSFEMRDEEGTFKVWQVKSGGESCDR